MAIELSNILIVFFTLSTYSLLYKENPFSVFAEHTFVGTAQAFVLVVALGYVKDYVLTPFSNGDYVPLIPLALGLMTYARFFDKYRWLARYPVAIAIAIEIAITLRTTAQVSILNQISATILPLFVANDIVKTIGNIIIVISVVTSILFFYFSKPHSGPLGTSAKIAFYLLYISMGAYYGNIFMGRVSIFNGRMTALLSESNIYLTIVMAVLILGIIFYLDQKKLLRKSIGYQ